MGNPAEQYLFYVTMYDITGKCTHTWMAPYISGNLGCYNTPSWKEFRYMSKEEAKEIKKLLDKRESIRSKNNATVKSEYKIMSLKSAVNKTIKRMKEYMFKRENSAYSNLLNIKETIKRDIDRETKGINEIPIYI